MSALLSALSREELELEEDLALRRARKSFLAFCLYVNPQFRSNWHIRRICKAIDDLIFGDLTRLYIALPPQIGKSTLCSIHMPAFMLGVNPETRIMAASYAETLSAHFNSEVQSLMRSEAYRRVFPDARFGRDTRPGERAGLQTQTTFGMIGRRGFLRSMGVGGAQTGFSADVGLVDDAVKNAEEASSPTIRDKTWGWFQGTFVCRLQKHAKLICLGTRWHEDDFLSRVLNLAKNSANKAAWRIIILPAIAENDPTPEDPRQIGEPLWAERFDRPQLEEKREILGERMFNALFQQRPSPPDGAYVRDSWWRFYDAVPAQFDSQVLSADLTFGATGDFTVLTAWGVLGAKRYLLDMFRARIPFTVQLKRFAEFCAKHPQATAKLVEIAANGAALKDTLDSHISGIVPIVPKGSKEMRLAAVAPVIEAGNVLLPSNAPWLETYLEEFRVFPHGVHDDAIDSTTMALSYIQRNNVSFSFSAISLGRTSPFEISL